MEKIAINKFIKPFLSNKIPKKPGLYLYKRKDKNKVYNSTIIDLIEIRKYKNVLLADSSEWYTFLCVKDVKKEYPGKWSSKIKMKKKS